MTSDVVDIEGVPSNTTFAMQMSYDDGINTYFDGPTGTATVAGSYIAKWNPNANGGAGAWVNAASLTTAGPDAKTAVARSLTTFLNAEYAGWLYLGRSWSEVGASI